MNYWWSKERGGAPVNYSTRFVVVECPLHSLYSDANVDVSVEISARSLKESILSDWQLCYFNLYPGGNGTILRILTFGIQA